MTLSRPHPLGKASAAESLGELSGLTLLLERSKYILRIRRVAEKARTVTCQSSAGEQHSHCNIVQQP